MAWSPDPAGRHISGATTGLILRFVRERAGNEALGRVMARAGESRSAAELADPKAWISYDTAVAMFEAAVDESGDPRAGYGIGAETLRQHTGTPVEALLRDLGSPGEVLRNIAATTSKFAAVSTMEAVEIGEDSARVAARCRPGFVRHPVFCDYVAGQLSQVSVLFGMEPATVVEEECQTRGDGRCLYRVSWGAGDGAEARIRELQGRLADMGSRMEALQSTAAALVSADDLGQVLSGIATRAGDAVRAQGYVLAVQAVDGGPVLVHHDGLAAGLVESLVRIVLGYEPAADPAHLLVDVASARRRYGRLMAIGPAGVGFLPAEKALLASYAEMAAAALDGATALEEARRRARTTGLLLDLARALANAEDVQEVCRRAAALVPSVVGADRGAVLLFDHGSQELRPAAGTFSGTVMSPAFDGYVLRRSESPELDRLMDHPGVRLYRRGDPHADVRAAIEVFGVEAYALVPVVSQGRFLGCVSAGWQSEPPDHLDAHIVERMAGLADQVAAALWTATLLEEARHQAHHDGLTGLPTQALAAGHVATAIDRCRRNGGNVSLLFCDLDGFKAVNDAYGHAAGDEVLRLVSQRMTGVVRASDCVARLGGDEFVVVIDGADAEGASVVAGKLIEELRRPFRLPAGEVFARLSVGIAVYPGDGRDFDALLGAADEAMYAAKREGRNAYRLVSAAAGARSRSSLDLDRDLVEAIANGDLTVHYQPQVDLRTGDHVAVEALVRWPHSTRGLIMPGAFLGLAADRGLIRDLDGFVIQRACADAAARLAAGPALPVAVNLSESHFSAPEALVELVTSALSATGLPPSLLEIEILESANIASRPEVLEALAELRSRGVRLCIDDFGTGYSILDRLRHLTVDKIKVAREFFGGGATALLETMVFLCRAVGARAVAEGIETGEQLQLARMCGFDVAQGDLLGRPQPMTPAGAPVLLGRATR